jgi:hypothetical protein
MGPQGPTGPIGPTGDSFWTQTGLNIYYDTGNAAVGGTPSGLRRLQSYGAANIGVYAENSSGTLAAMYATNTGTGPALRTASGDVQLATTDGDVGVGTTSPTEKLHVDEGNVLVSGAAGQSIALRDGDGDRAIVMSSTSTGIGNDIKVYRDNVLATEFLDVSQGLQSVWFNTVTNGLVMAGGVSSPDDSGFWQIHDLDGLRTVWLDADNDQSNNGVSAGALQIRSRGGGPGGELNIQNDDGATRLAAFGGGTADGSFMEFYNSIGDRTILLDGEAGTGADLMMFNDAGIETVDIDSELSGAGVIEVSNGVTSAAKVLIDGDGASDDGGEVTVRATDGSSTVLLDGQSTNDGGRVSVRNDISEETIQALGDNGDDAGLIKVLDRNGTQNVDGISLDARDTFSTGSQILMQDTAGALTVEIDSQDGAHGEIALWDSTGARTFRFFQNTLTVYNDAGVGTWSINGNGAKNAIMHTPDHGSRLVYTQESTEVWFEDFGSGQLVAGEIRIDLDPVFLQTVTIDAEHPMKVFITLNGDCNGVFVVKDLDHFVVRELRNGASFAAFDYRVVAKRRGFEDDRLEQWTDPDADPNSDDALGAVQFPVPVVDDGEEFPFEDEPAPPQVEHPLDSDQVVGNTVASNRR